MKIHNNVEHDVQEVLEDFKNQYSSLVENLVKMLPKGPNKYSVNTVTKYDEHIQDDHFNHASISGNLILTVLKVM